MKPGFLISSLAALLLVAAGCASSGTPSQPSEAGHEHAHAAGQPQEGAPRAISASDHDALLAEWGIELIGIRLTAADYALDFRYRVIDPERAAPLLQRKYSRNPYLIVEKSGAMLGVPWSEKVGTMRQSVRTANQIKAGKRYFALFANPSRHVKAGDKVSLVIGDFRADGLVVQ